MPLSSAGWRCWQRPEFRCAWVVSGALCRRCQVPAGGRVVDLGQTGDARLLQRTIAVLRHLLSPRAIRALGGGRCPGACRAEPRNAGAGSAGAAREPAAGVRVP
ncbi:hypothetical protein ACFSTD_06665 [Novosphingobium colocasiae]